MSKVEELQALFQYFISPTRIRKVGTLIREQWSSLIYRSDTDSQSNVNLPEDSEFEPWTVKEVRQVDPDYWAQIYKSSDDRAEKDGIHATYEYQVHKIYGATSYTNETTHRSIFDRFDRQIPSLCSKRGKAAPPAQRRLSVDRTLDGVTANLYGNLAVAEGNYFHWLIDGLARLFLIERYQPLDQIDYLLVPPLKYDFHWDSLEALGFDRSQIIELQPLQCIRFNCLLATTPPRGRNSAVCPGWIIDRYRTILLEHAKDTKSSAGKRIYISRRDAPKRMFTNEEVVCQELEANGFDIVELTPLNLWQKIAVFRDAEFVIGQTGAGLTNLIFSPSNVIFLELADKNLVSPLYATVVAHIGGTHHTHFFSSDSMVARVTPIVAKSSIDIDQLKDTINKLTS